jgi:hypothetical protein
MLFIGDSHMAQYWTRVRRIAAERPTTFREIEFITLGGCPPLPGVNRASAGATCDQVHDFAFGRAQSPDVKTVVLGGWWEAYWSRTYDVYSSPSPDQVHDRIYRVDDPTATPLEIDSPAALRTFSEFGVELAKLVRAQKQVFIVLSNPTSRRFDPILMYSRFTGQLIRLAPIEREQFIARVHPVMARLARLRGTRGQR